MEIREVLPSAERMRVLEKLQPVIALYGKVLKEDSHHYERVDLAKRAEEELQAHLLQLETLAAFLAELGKNPASFATTVQKVSQEEGSFTARFKRKSDFPFGAGEEKAQTQISFYVKERAVFETEEETTKALSLRGLSPQETIEQRDRELTASRVDITTVRVFRDQETGRVKLIPQAGIQIAKIAEEIRFFGVKYVGTQPHLHEVSPLESFNQEDYKNLEEITKALSGYHRPSRHS